MAAIKTYAAISIHPSSQFDRPSNTIVIRIKTLNVITDVCIPPKSKSMSLPDAQAKMTANGTTNRAICVEEPTAMLTAKPGRSWIAKRTAAICSHAFPTIGKSMTPMKDSVRAVFSATSRTASTRNSDETAVAKVVKNNNAMAIPKDMLGPSSSSC